MTIPSTRIQYMDALKIFTMFLVIWGHCIQFLLSTPPYESPVYRMIYAFHMPLFMTISGYFASNIAKRSFFNLLLNKARQLLFPVLAFGLLLGLIRWLLYDNLGLVNRLAACVVREFWFLKCLFACYMIYYAVSKLKERNKWLYFFSIIVSLIIARFITYSDVWRMYPFFVIGTLLYDYENIVKIFQKKILLLTGSTFAVMLYYYGKNFFLPQAVWEFLYNYAIGGFGSLFFILLFNSLEKKVSFGSIGDKICKWGQYTLGIYILQVFFIETFAAKYFSFDSMNTIIFSLIVSSLFALFTLVLCVKIVELIQKYLPNVSFYILGGIKPQK